MENGELTLSEVTRAVGFPKASVHRVVQVLVDEGLLEQAEGGGPYQLGVRLLGFARVVTTGLDVRKRALPAMTRLCDRFGETVYLLVPRQDRAVCVERLEGTHMLRDLTTQVGSALPLYVGAAPIAMLAHQPDDVVDQVLASPLTPLTPYSCVDPEKLRSQLATIRDSGWVWSQQDVGIGAGAVGAPLFDHNGKVAAGLSVGGQLERIKARLYELTDAVLRAANEASWAMGFPGALPLGRQSKAVAVTGPQG